MTTSPSTSDPSDSERTPIPVPVPSYEKAPSATGVVVPSEGQSAAASLRQPPDPLESTQPSLEADAAPEDTAFGRRISQAQDAVDALGDTSPEAQQALSDEPLVGPKPAGKQ